MSTSYEQGQSITPNDNANLPFVAEAISSASGGVAYVDYENGGQKVALFLEPGQPHISRIIKVWATHPHAHRDHRKATEITAFAQVSQAGYTAAVLEALMAEREQRVTSDQSLRGDIQTRVKSINGERADIEGEISLTAAGLGAAPADGSVSIPVREKLVLGSPSPAENAADLAQVLASGAKKILLPAGRHLFDEIDVSDFFGLTFIGAGKHATVVEFTGNGERGFYAHEKPGEGGALHLKLKGMSFDDPQEISNRRAMVEVRGGMTGQNPTEVGGYIDLEDVSVIKYNSVTGAAFSLTNLSHVTVAKCSNNYHIDCALGLLIANDRDINTGVATVTDGYFPAGKTSMAIEGNLSLLDSFTITGTYFGNRRGLLNSGDHTIKVTGNVAALDFRANHIEQGGSEEHAALYLNGVLQASEFSANHFSANPDISKTAVLFSGCNARASQFGPNEFLNYPSYLNGGRLFAFDSDCTGSRKEPLTISPQRKNTGNPVTIDVEEGPNADSVWSGILTDPRVLNRAFKSISTGTAKSFTPPSSEGMMMISINNRPENSGIIAYRAEAGGASCVSMGNHPGFTAGTGVLDGTTGPTSSFNVSAATDGRIYLENRLGVGINCFVAEMMNPDSI